MIIYDAVHTCVGSKRMSFLQRSFFLLTLLTTSFSSLLVGVVTRDAAIISSSGVLSKNGVAMREDFDWIRTLGEACLVGIQGDSSDCEFLLTQLESSNRDHELKFGYSLSCRSVAHLCRRIVAKFLRSNQLKVSVLIAGWNSKIDCPSLYWLDSIGAIQEVPYGAHGEGFSFVLGLLDSRNRQSFSDKSAIVPTTLSSSFWEEVEKKEETQPSIQQSEIDIDGSQLSQIDSGSAHDLLRFPSTGERQTSKRGSISQMSLREGVSTIQSCMESAKKRIVQTLGPSRIKVVTASGCIDLGFTKLV